MNFLKKQKSRTLEIVWGEIEKQLFFVQKKKKNVGFGPLCNEVIFSKEFIDQKATGEKKWAWIREILGG